MPPKSAENKGKYKGKEAAKPQSRTQKRIEQVSPEQVLKNKVDELNQKLESVVLEKRLADETRNYMQLERDKINTFWDVSKAEIQDLRAQLREKDRVADDVADEHLTEVKVYKQKIKHLLYEHQCNVEALKVEAENKVKEALQSCKARADALLEDKARLKEQNRVQKAEIEAALLGSKMELSKEVSRLTLESSNKAKELASVYDRRLADMKNELESRHKAAIEAIEDHKAADIQDLIRKHSDAYEGMRSYFNDITANTLDLIVTLKADAADMKKRENAAEVLAIELAQENKKLIEPLMLAQREAEEMRTRSKNFDISVSQLHVCESRLAACEKRCRQLEWKNEVLEQQLQVIDAQKRAITITSLTTPAFVDKTQQQVIVV